MYRQALIYRGVPGDTGETLGETKLNNRAIRSSLILAILACGAWSTASGDTVPLQLGVTTLAALTALWFGWSTKNSLWSIIGMYFVALAANAAMWGLQPGPDWEVGARITLVPIVFFGAAAVWLTGRPYLSDRAHRGNVRIIVVGSLLTLSSAILLDAREMATLSRPMIMVAFGALGFLGLAVMITGVVRFAMPPSPLQRRTDVRLSIAALAYASVQMTGLVLEQPAIVRLGAAMVAGLTMLAATTAGADQLGQPLGEEESFRVRLWPLILGSLGLTAAHASLQFDLDDGGVRVIAAVTVCVAVGAMAFAGRELGGPNKPLVVPFGRRDRALQKLPSALLSGDVQLVGQPVRRNGDSQIIGIEARLDWASRQAQPGSIDSVAADAGLTRLLDSVTLELAQAHLPAVLCAIDADEPWLSIPLSENAEAARLLPERGSVDGLVLRVPTAELALAVDGLRDHGAMVQTTERLAQDVEAEIVDGLPSGQTVGVPLRIVPSSTLADVTDRASVNLVVDDVHPPTSLALILAPIDNDDHSSVREVVANPD